MFCTFSKLGCPAKLASSADLKQHEKECIYAAVLRKFNTERISEAEAAGEVSEMAKQIDSRREKECFDVIERIARNIKKLGRADLARFQDMQAGLVAEQPPGVESVIYEEAESYENAYKPTPITMGRTPNEHLSSVSHESEKAGAHADGGPAGEQYGSDSFAAKIPPESPLKPRVAFEAQRVQDSRDKAPEAFRRQRSGEMDYLDAGDLASEPVGSADTSESDGFSKNKEEGLANRIAAGFKALEQQRSASADKVHRHVESRQNSARTHEKQSVLDEEMPRSGYQGNYPSPESRISLPPNEQSVVNIFIDSGDDSPMAQGNPASPFVSDDLKSKLAQAESQVQQQAMEIIKLRQQMANTQQTDTRQRQLEQDVARLQEDNIALRNQLSQAEQKTLDSAGELTARQTENEQLKKFNKELMDQLSKAQAQVAHGKLELQRVGTGPNMQAMQKTIAQQQAEICELIQQNQELLLEQTKTDEEHDNFNNYIAYLNKNVQNLITQNARNEATFLSRVRYLQDYAKMATNDCEEARKALEQVTLEFERFVYESGNFAVLRVEQARLQDVRQKQAPTAWVPPQAQPTWPATYATSEPPVKPRTTPEEQYTSVGTAAQARRPSGASTAMHDSFYANMQQPRRPAAHNIAERSEGVFAKYENAPFDQGQTPLEQRQRRSGSAIKAAENHPIYRPDPVGPRNDKIIELQRESMQRLAQVHEAVSQMVRQSAGQNEGGRSGEDWSAQDAYLSGPALGIPKSEVPFSSRRYE